MKTMKVRMSETYGRLLAGKDYRVDDGTARSLVSMDKAAIVPEKKKRVKVKKPSVTVKAVAATEEVG